jgi:hypothetical protein
MVIGFEYDCGCGISADERLELLATSPIQLTDWKQVLAPTKECRTCNVKQRHLFRRLKLGGDNTVIQKTE